jgi:D-xylose transport system permease protein
MSATQQVTDVDIAAAGDQGGIGQALRDYWTRVKGGEVGSLPAVLGLIVLLILFSALKPSTFFSYLNFANLLNQGTAIIVLAMGLIFVLLLGEIDLSAGFTAGTAAVVLAIALTSWGLAWPIALIIGLLRNAGSASHRPARGAAGHPVVRRDTGDVPGPAGPHAADHR